MGIGKTLTRIIAAIAVLGALALRPAAADRQRELGAQGGRGTLNIAVEGARLSMELAVPGMDIAGFERAAKLREEKLDVFLITAKGPAKFAVNRDTPHIDPAGMM